MEKRGAPTKFDDKMIKQAAILCAEFGFTDRKLADFFSVTEQTINNWKKKFPDFFESLKEAKSIADDLVEKALFERATGYNCPDTKVIFNEGQFYTHETTRHYPPDTAAAIIWLKNRRPDAWRNNPEPDGASVLSGELRDLISKLPK